VAAEHFSQEDIELLAAGTAMKREVRT